MKKISTGGKILIAAGLIFLAALTHYILVNVFGVGDGRPLVMTDTGASVKYDISDGALFYSNDNGNFYFCTKDGIEYISSDGKSVWKEIFSLTKPNMVTAGEMVAVGDSMGRHIYVYNPDGLAFDVELPYPALTFSINRTGYLSVILQLESGYSARIYNSRNDVSPLAYYELHDALRHPVSMDVSEDGLVAVLAVWDLDLRFASRVLFYYVNETDAWNTADAMGMFASQNYDGQAVHTVRFMSENRALVFTDAQVSCFQPGENNACPEIWSFPLHNELRMLSFYNGNAFALAVGETLLNAAEPSKQGDIHIYNVSGELTGVFELGFEATSLSMGRDGVLVGAGRRFYALNNSGEQLWDYNAAFDARGLYFLNNTDTVLVAGNTGAQIMKREKEKMPEIPPEEILPDDIAPEEITEEGDLQVEPD